MTLSFQVADYEGLYAKLIKLRDQDVPDTFRELLKKKGIPSEKIETLTQRSEKLGRFSTNKIPLPSPLQNLETEIRSDGQVYIGRGVITVVESGLYAGRKDIQEIKKRVLDKTPTTDRIINIGDNLLVCHNKIPFFTLQESGLYLTLNFGDCGTAPRHLTNQEQLQTDMQAFCDHLGDFINKMYETEQPDIDYQLFFQ